jgi:hypothetical protein
LHREYGRRKSRGVAEEAESGVALSSQEEAESGADVAAAGNQDPLPGEFTIIS